MRSRLLLSRFVAILAAVVLPLTPSALAQETAAAGLEWTLAPVAGEPACPNGGSTVTAYVATLDQVLTFNRLGAQLSDGMMFALALDVFPTGTTPANETVANSCRFAKCQAGKVQLRSTKRPRPLVLRVNEGQCLQLVFSNFLASPGTSAGSQALASLHLQGMEWLQSAEDDGSWVGANPSSLVEPSDPVVVPPNGQHVYTLFARHEGSYLLYSAADTWTNSLASDGGQLAQGLFGAVHVEPAGAMWFRSQVTEQELCRASRDGSGAPCTRATPDLLPKINYYATDSTRSNLPVLNMLNCATQSTQGCPGGGELVASDLTAVITGRTANGQPGNFPTDAVVRPVFNPSYALPDRLQPYREFTIIYHEAFSTDQAFANVYTNVLNGDGTGADFFGFNYGMGGIGSEILANRFGVGPMADCTSCKYEEFFLASWAVGDPAMVTDVLGDEGCVWEPKKLTYDCSKHGRATKALYPDDPSNVYHSYIADHTKFRILHGGVDLHHLHHQHAHQWMHSPDTPNGDYTDSQSIGPGSSFTLEMVYNGSGNVNQTVGDSIFHCHFYPHFAGGMWSLWRVHDVFEPGTELDASGKPKTGAIPSLGPVTTARALPDGEIAVGTPIPGLIPLPTRPMAPMPAKVVLVKEATQAWVCRTLPDKSTECQSSLNAGDPGTDGTWKNPGFPFFIPGVAGQRATHPPMDFAYVCSDNGQSCTPAFGGQPANLSKCGSTSARCDALDGGLPRHLILGGGTANTPPLNTQDFSKTLESVAGLSVAEEGTLIEKVAMATHAKRFHPTQTPEGASAQFTLNGLPPRQGAPYADPCINYSPNGGVPAGLKTRFYRAADIQLDVKFNKEGWHFPQQRMLSLWGDVQATLQGTRAPEPLFFRANSGECIEYTLANLVPNVYELDDFEVRTPTDILGQHIHLVKFDVTSSDGATNGFNYEDGTFSPDEVTERIKAINAGTWNGAKGTLVPKHLPFFGPGPGGRWVGAQATIQRWYADPLFDGATHNPPMPGAQDRTLRTVFTHDHFGPSTHQQAGLYAGLVIEPKGSNWYSNEIGAGIPNQLGGVAANGDPLILRTPTGYDGKSIPDGGPTSWQAVIDLPDRTKSFREFLLEVQDSTLTYAQFNITQPAAFSQGFCPDAGGASCTPATVQNYSQPATRCSKGPCIAKGYCSNKQTTACWPSPWGTPDQISQQCGATGATCNLVAGIPGVCNGCASPDNNNPPLPQNWATTPIDSAKGPEVITLSNATNNFSFNYRNEPLYPRINSGSTKANASDLAFAYSSTVDRGTKLSGDPYTLLLRSYAGDDVQVRTLMGGHINPHNFTIHGIKWLAEPSMVDSGWRNSQVMGISEHFEQIFRVPSWVSAQGTADYLLMTGASAVEQAGGNWGLLRSYGSIRSDLRPLFQNGDPRRNANISTCPQSLQPPFTTRRYDVVAITAKQALGSTGLVYNQKLGISDPNAILYYKLSDLNCNAPATTCTAKSQNVEPLVLRANAGDCIQVNLYNAINLTAAPDGAGSPTVLPECPSSGAPGTCPSTTSLNVGLHPQLVSFNVTSGSGFNSGLNPTQTVAPLPGGLSPTCLANPNSKVNCQSYTWYAGNIDTSVVPAKYIPIEFGAANLLPADVINHYQHGLFGALIIEPVGAEGWNTTDGITAVVSTNQVRFREFVLAYQDALSNPLSTPAFGFDYDAINLRTEPLFSNPNGNNQRFCDSQCTIPSGGTPTNVGCVLAGNTQAKTNSYCCTAYTTTNNVTTCTSCSACATPPATPTLRACAGEQVRLRLVHAGGSNTDQVFELFGHVWAETPYMSVGPGCIPPTTHTNLYSSSTINDQHRCTPQFLGQDGYNATLASFGAVSDSLTDWQGSRMGHGPGNHYDILINSAGGINKVPGDYLFRTYPAMHFRLGPWGIFQVVSPGDPLCKATY